MRLENKSSPLWGFSSYALGIISTIAGFGRPFWFPIEAKARPSVEGMRFELVDTARGLCLFWMTLAHVLSVSEVGGGSWLTFLYLPGWSTTNFVMLSGFALGLLSKAARGGTASAFGGKWYRRALTLLAISYLSNVFFTLLKAGVIGNLSVLELGRGLTLQEPWTISCILLPTAVLLCLAGVLERAAHFVGSAGFFLGVTALVFISWAGLSYLTPEIRGGGAFVSLFEFDNPWFGFPLGLLLELGIWAYSFGIAFRNQKAQPWLLLGGGLLSLLLYIPQAINPINYLFRFEATLLISLMIGRLSFPRGPKDLLNLLGRSSLLVFLLHRLLIQLEQILLSTLSANLRAPLMLVLTLALCALGCDYKEKSPRLTSALKRVGI